MDDPKDRIKRGQCTDPSIVDIELACKLKHEQTWNISETQFVAKPYSLFNSDSVTTGKNSFQYLSCSGHK